MRGRAGPNRVVLLRHGATEWSEARRHTGWTDLPLNAAGLAQARALRQALTAYTFSAVFCSPLRRARDTCVAAGFGDSAILDPDLREWNYGDYEGRTGDEIREDVPGWDLWKDGVAGGESLDEVAARAARFIGRLGVTSGTVAVFAHGHLLRILTSLWIGQDPRLAQFLYLGTAAISTLGYEHDWRAITLWDSTDHLARE
ncbi:MAG: histidine phosphatase family protein [Candidatus Dormibacteria bacterium]